MKRAISPLFAIVCIISVGVFIYTDDADLKKVCQAIIAVTSIINLIISFRKKNQE